MMRAPAIQQSRRAVLRPHFSAWGRVLRSREPAREEMPMSMLNTEVQSSGVRSRSKR